MIEWTTNLYITITIPLAQLLQSSYRGQVVGTICLGASVYYAMSLKHAYNYVTESLVNNKKNQDFK